MKQPRPISAITCSSLLGKLEVGASGIPNSRAISSPRWMMAKLKNRHFLVMLIHLTLAFSQLRNIM